MNVDGKWSDVCIHDVSDKGLLVSSDAPPAIGTYVDLRRGTLVIIGRVVWCGGRRFGVRTQDPVRLATLISEPVLDKRPANANRRGANRGVSGRSITVQADRNRQLSSALQFVCLASFGLAVACFAAICGYQVMSVPAVAVASVLDKAAT